MQTLVVQTKQFMICLLSHLFISRNEVASAHLKGPLWLVQDKLQLGVHALYSILYILQVPTVHNQAVLDTMVAVLEESYIIVQASLLVIELVDSAQVSVV